MPIDLAHPEAEIEKAVTGTAALLREMLRNGELDIILSWSLNLISAILILIAGRMLGTFIARRIRNARRLEPTLAGFLATFARYAIAAVAIVTVLGQFGVQTASLLAVLGAAGLAIGLALQGTLSNVAAGVMLLVLRPFKVGDAINADNITGTVQTLGLFGTEITTADNVYIFVPNSMLWNNDIVNYTRNRQRRQDINIKIRYEDDLGKVFAIIHDLIAADPRIVQAEPGKKPVVAVDRLGDLGAEIVVRFWSAREDFGNLRFEITRAIRDGLAAAGISIASLPLAAPNTPA